MAIRDNLKAASSKKLYEALQYSGLVTENMTFDEMCAILAQEYPSFFVLYKDGVNAANFANYAGNSQGHNYSNTDANYSDLTITLGENINAVFSGTNGTRITSIVSDAIDVSAFNKLKFNHTITAKSNSNTIRHISVFLTKVLEEKMNAAAEVVLLSTTGTSASGAKELNISALEGKYYIGINLITQSDVNISIGDMILEV